MRTVVMDRDQLRTTLENARWFAGYRISWKKICENNYIVRTNYIPVLT